MRAFRQNSRGFGPVYKGVVECDGLGVCGSDFDELTFHNVARPVFPLDVVSSHLFRAFLSNSPPPG